MSNSTSRGTRCLNMALDNESTSFATPDHQGSTTGAKVHFHDQYIRDTVPGGLQNLLIIENF
jgi:hypothetical protein